MPACLALVGWSDRRPWRFVGVAAAALAFVMAVFGIALHIDGPPTWFVLALTVAVVVGVANASAGAAGAAAVLRVLALAGFAIAGLAASQHDQHDTLFARVATAAGFAAACASLGLVILARLGRTRAPPSSSSSLAGVTLDCPRCHATRTAPFGASACAACGQRLRVELA